jgi:predicted nuclease of restriction endonuclease-like (RecB) superfamily
MLGSRQKEEVKKEMLENTQPLAPQPADFIKDPYVLEFLSLPSNLPYKEKDLENAVIQHLQQFLLELGSGFAFVAQQQHIRTESSDFFIDLVFYHIRLKCFVLIDLKMGKLTHQDIGQMDMYVRLYNDLQKEETDNPTVGIILCSQKDETIVKYSVLAENKSLFASKYQFHLPTEEQLKQWIEADRARIEQQLLQTEIK